MKGPSAASARCRARYFDDAVALNETTKFVTRWERDSDHVMCPHKARLAVAMGYKPLAKTPFQRSAALLGVGS